MEFLFRAAAPLRDVGIVGVIALASGVSDRRLDDRSACDGISHSFYLNIIIPVV